MALDMHCKSYNHYNRPKLINGQITFTDVVETANNTLTLMTLEYIAKNHYKFEIKKQFQILNQEFEYSLRGIISVLNGKCTLSGYATWKGVSLTIEVPGLTFNFSIKVNGRGCVKNDCIYINYLEEAGEERRERASFLPRYSDFIESVDDISFIMVYDLKNHSN